MRSLFALNAAELAGITTMKARSQKADTAQIVGRRWTVKIMGKRLVRIDIDAWGGGLTVTEYPIVKETEHVVFIVRERERRNPETGYKETVRMAGPFNRKDIGVISCSNQRMIHGAKRMYIVLGTDDNDDALFKNAVAEMFDEIQEELDAAKMFLEILEHNINMGDENEQGG